MENHLLKFIEQVRSLKENDTDTDNTVVAEYNRIRQQIPIMKQTLGLTNEAGGLKENVKKNRYKDILPYDQSRVPLTLTLGENESDYINASFIKGATENRTYIATQGPLSNTVVDFWRMIWEYDVKVIVMACREFEMGKKKCECYWAPENETATYGPFVVSHLTESNDEEVIVRTLIVRLHDESRTVSQFQYMAWPDHGIPYKPDGILGMMEKVRVAQGSNSAPTVIHCSAGCGRTGVICVIDYVHDLLLAKKINGDFRIMDIVLELRRQRPSVVQTKEQYIFAFHTVALMFKQALQNTPNHSNNLTKHTSSLYDNVVTPKPRLRFTPSDSVSASAAVSKPILQPRTSYPPPRKMNDTYAVVNKLKPPPSSMTPCPPDTVHLYDNTNLGGQKSPATALYSAVKPKSRAVGNPPPMTNPIYETAVATNQRAAEASEGVGHSGYGLLPGDFRSNNRDSQLFSPATRMPSESNSSADDDYEYVSSPLKDSSGYCPPGSLGFNCRIKKPRGPRDPPAEWSRAEW
ncbi:tyrosine-protein phosphatase non-receptor type 18 [Chanos chanos]|uniref:protein-tyrosine-phosphatase n=1 Tax=Chanos chanos TaxID=29144 RepID=A0A6J2W826_CHACN|nr:tyrosine-protein phosphatase non-receptor type 18-like [Chanos chanos]XP_030640400.1 tyrosine-protein phosphatase non-receptor type 18-like [Chanos chanos]